MKITIIAVGRLKERFWTDACHEYVKRLTPYAKIVVKEVSDVDPAKAGGASKAAIQEGQAVLKVLPAHDHVIALTIDGIQRTSIGIAQHLGELACGGKGSVSFVIGGSVGLSEEVLARADETLSLGAITLPHNLARVVVLEQVYRAFKILHKEPYHK